ncbi:MAG: type VI secretion system baseplate subunit TssK [Bryobacteraceae bacterium]
MKHLARVVWSEGMYLGPHHFQAQSRYFEDSIHFATSALWFEGYGLVGCGLDAEALRNGTLSLLHARGILPDGLSFHMPECDALPPARNITELFPPTRDKVTVLLGLPGHKPGAANCAMTPAPQTTARYVAEAHPTWDETTGRDEKPVQFGRKNFALFLDEEMPEGVVGLPIARVMRDGSGHFIFDPEFIPPSTHIGASERLTRMLGRLIGILEEKSSAMSAQPGGAGRTWSEYSTRDIAQFWLLHTVNAALAPLRQLAAAPRVHPEELFVEMLRLGGALCTFAIESHPRVLPLYDHLKLDECFGALDHHIRTHLETVVPTNVVTIPLRKTADYFYEGDVTDQRCLDASRWIFSIRAPVGEVDLISKTPQLVKICSQLFIPKLVERALPGMPLAHLPVPPSAISTRVDAQYFSVSKGGPCWDHIVKTRLVGVYVPGELPEPNLELLVVLES